MIGVTGYMSGGKTYTSVRLMLDNLLTRHRVCTNVLLNCRGVSAFLETPCVLWKPLYYFICEDGDYPEFQYNRLGISDYYGWPEGKPRGDPEYDRYKVFIYLDEVSSLFDSMISASDEGVKAVATWARHTEKRGQMMYLIMQFATELHKRLRSHVTEYLHCTNTSSLRLPLVGWRFPPFLRQLIVVRHVMPDMETQMGDNMWFRLHKEVYACYNTAQIVVGHKSSDLFTPPPAVVNPDSFLQFWMRLEVVSLWLGLMTALWLVVSFS